MSHVQDKSSQTYFTITMMHDLRNILFSFLPPHSTHTFLLGSELFSSYSANSSQRHSLITAKGSPTSPQTPGYGRGQWWSKTWKEAWEALN